MEALEAMEAVCVEQNRREWEELGFQSRVEMGP